MLTVAGIFSNAILAMCTIQTGIGTALIDVLFAEWTSKTRKASAGKVPNSINTNSCILTRIGVAFIDVLFAPISGEARRTLTGEVPSRKLLADSLVQTGVGVAVVQLFTLWS